MKIYYIASPRGIKEFSNLYCKTYQMLQDLGNVLVDDYIITVDVEKFYSASYDYRIKHYKRVMESIRKCDVAIVETSIHSLSMGYIIDKALDLGKPVIVLHLKGYEPYFCTCIQNDKVQIYEYNSSNVKDILKAALEEAKQQIDLRFTLLLPPKIVSFLDEVVKKQRIPRSVYIRRLIEADIKKKK